VQVSIFKQLSVAINAADCEIHHTVLPKTIAFTVSAAVYSLSGLSDECIEETSSLKIQTILLSKPWHQKHLTKTKHNGTIYRNLPWMKNQTFLNKEFRLQFHFCRHVLNPRW